MKSAYYCMDNPEHQMFKANVDGDRCPQCKGLVNNVPVSIEEYNELPTYDSLRKPINKGPKGIQVNLLFDDNQILKLRAIAKHTEALANELDAIDAAKCSDCGGLLDISELYSDGVIVDTSAYCGNCRD